MSAARSEFSADLRAGEPSVAPRVFRKRASLARILIAFCAGIAASLAWQSYSDPVGEMIASAYPQLGWLAPQAARSAQSAPGTIGLAADASPSPDPQQLKEMSLDLAAVRLMVDQLAAGQERMARDFTTK